jgi:Domain of unknown function (DUF222)
MPARDATTTTTPPDAFDMRSARSMGTGDVATLSTERIMELAAESARHMASLAGLIALLTAELGRREGWRTEGATSLEGWMVERMGLSVPTARAFAHVGERLFDLPHLASGLSAGTLSFDKVRAVVDAATPETDEELRDRAEECTAVELAQLARRHKATPPAKTRDTRSLRFNDNFQTVTAQLPAESYAEVRAALEAEAKELPSDGETPWDQRLCDAFLALIRSRTSPRNADSRYTVVVHAPLDVLLDDENDLPGELERHGGLISADTVRRVACDATVILAVDDDVGHTMYEGRAHRYPTQTQRREIMRRDRHCRFPGCSNVTFVNPHHIKWWKPHQGTTDLPNLALLCEHHHHLVHSKAWTMSGDANEELTFVGPSGRVMTSRPSPLWTSLSGGGSSFRTRTQSPRPG